MLILHPVMHSSALLQGIRLLAKNQNRVTYTHRSCFCFSDLGRHPICGQQSLCLKLGMCCFLCVRRVVAMSWLVSYYHPSPASFSPKHRHTQKHTHRFGQQPRLQHREAKLVLICQVTKSRERDKLFTVVCCKEKNQHLSKCLNVDQRTQSEHLTSKKLFLF